MWRAKANLDTVWWVLLLPVTDKVTGNASEKYHKMDINDNQTWYIAPNIGIVKQISNYMGEKNSVIIELCEITGL